MTRTTLNPSAKNAVPSLRSGLKSRKPSPLALEARLMFDGAAIATHAPDAAAPAPEAAVLERALPAERGVASVASEAAREGAQVIGRDGAPKEIVFVDAGVTDWQKLVANAKPGLEVVVLDPTRDGLTQIAETLAGRSGLDAIHVISHGGDGKLILGGKDVDQTALAAHQGDLQKIGQALSTNGDILLYGCDIAKGTAGAAFVDAVAKATSADVAASTDATGSAVKRGDWDLEYAAGKIDVAPVIRAADVTSYNGLLASMTLDLDKNNSSGKTGFDYQTTYDYREGRFPVCDADVSIDLAPGTTWDDVSEVVIKINNPKAGDALDPNWTYGHKLYTSLSADGTEVSIKRGYLETSITDWYDSIKQVHFKINTSDHSDRTVVFSIRERGAINPASLAYATIKVPVNTNASISADAGGDYSVTERGVGVSGDTVARGKLTVNESDAGQVGFRPPPSLSGRYGDFTFDTATGVWGYALDNTKADSLTAGQVVSDSLTVRSYDGTATSTITVNITGSNDAPIVTSGTTASVAENAATSTVVYQATGSDPDANDKIVWYLSEGDAGKFNIGTDGKVTLKASANYEAQSSYSFNVVGTDTRGDSSIKAVTVSVTNVNEAPTITSGASAQVNENASANTVIYTATGDDPDANDKVTWSLTGTDADKFTIGADGKVKLKASADYEAQSSYSFNVVATDKLGLKTSKGVTVAVNDLNEAPSITSGSSASVVENALPSTVIYTATATDPDAGDKVTWSLTGANAGKFNIDTDGKVTLKASADYEAQSSYSFKVVATDTRGDVSSKAVTVSVTNVNEAPVAQNDSASAVEAGGWLNNYAGTDPTGNVLTNDTDADAGDSKTVSAVSGVAAGTVGGATAGRYGTLILGANGNYSYRVANDNATVQALRNPTDTLTDTFRYTVRDTAGLTSTATLTVTIAGTNDIPDITPSNTDFSVTEAGVGVPGDASASGIITIRDPDAGQSVFSLPSSLAGTYGTFTLSLNAAKDVGTWTYSLDPAKSDRLAAGQKVEDGLFVPCADGSMRWIGVSITGSNDQAVITGNASGSVTEDANVSWFGNLVADGKLNVSDPDSGESRFSTNVTAGSGAWGDLQIDRNGNWTYWVDNGNVQELKDGATHTDTFTVRSLDGTTQLISVTINGTNDAPRITSDNNGGVWENSAASTVVYAAKASDRDQGDTLAWSLEGADAAAFSIGADGKVRLNAPANYEVKDHYHLTVVATDELGTKDRQGVTVYVGDVDDPTVVSGDLAGRIDENGKKITGDLNASDEDGPANFFSDNLIGKYGRFSMDSEGRWTYTLDRAQDQLADGQTLTEKFMVYVHEHPWGVAQPLYVTVTIVGSNDAAVITGDTGGAITESDVAQSVGGKLSATDVDDVPFVKPRATDGLKEAIFVASEVPSAPATTFVAGTFDGRYGQLSIAKDGTWNYVMDGPHNEFEQGKTYTDTFTVRTADGTTQLVTLTLNGSNDAALISGDMNAKFDETDVPQSVSGKLAATDIDSAPLFVGEALAGKYGSLSIGKDGTWNYVMDSAHNEFEQGKVYTDTFTVRTADGTTQLVTITIDGTSDVIPVGRESLPGGLAGNPSGLFDGGADNPFRVSGFRGDVTGSRVPGQSDAPSGGGLRAFNPNALIELAPTAAGLLDQESGEFERFELVQAGAIGDKDDFVAFIPAGTKASFALPAEFMEGSQAPDFLALQNNGEALPEWLVFDAASGKFIGKAPEGMHATLRIQLTGKDAQGRDRVIRVALDVDVAEPGRTAEASSDSLRNGRADGSLVRSSPAGRPSLSDQIQASRRASNGAERLVRAAVPVEATTL